MASRVIQFLIVCLLVSLNNPAIAAPDSRIAFTQNTYNFDAKVGVNFNLNLVTLLSDKGSNRVWSTDSNMPAWLTLNGTAETLVGTPKTTNIGNSSFRLFVQDGEQGAITQIRVRVLQPPKWTNSPLDLGIQNEGNAFTLDLKTKITNPAGGTPTFSATGLPGWLSLNSNGTLSGTPRRPDVGKYSGIVFTVSSIGGSASVNAFGEVLKTIVAPKWQTNPITLPDALEDSQYNQIISTFVDNPEGTTLTFTKVSGTGWVKVSNQGTLFGAPKAADIGNASAVVSFRTTVDGKVYQESTEFKVKVVHVNHPPKWNADPIQLPEAFTGVSYNHPLQGAFTDPDVGDTHTIVKLSGPNWITVAKDGTVAGTPTKSDVGGNSFTVRVTDQDGASDTATVNLEIIKSNEPPIWLMNPVVLKPNAKEDAAYNHDLSQYASDPDNDPLTFTLLQGPSWATVDTSGVLRGSPDGKDVGLNKFSVRVTDNISGNDVADILIEVEHTNHNPYWVLDPIFFQVQEDGTLNASVAPYAKDDDPGDTLSFSKVQGPNWATLDSKGNFTGKPGAAEVGDNDYVVRVIDNNGGEAIAKVVIKVIHVNHPPYWTQDPITLPNAQERASYSSSVSTWAKDDDPGDKLRFTKISGPSWIMVGNDGSVIGTPARVNVGLNSFKVRVLDQDNADAIVTVQITVEKVNIPPRWRQDPIVMADGFEDTAYTFDLTPYAVDDDGDTPLTFRLVSGPDWMQVSADGKVTGTPKKKDLGKFTARFAVSDGSAETECDGEGQVLPINHAPVWVDTALEFTVKEREVFSVDLNDKKYVSDPDNDVLRFSMTNAPAWASLSPNGALQLKPVHMHIGSYEFDVRVDDSELFDDAKLKVIVVRDPRPPVWLQDPIRYEAKTNEPFNESLKDKAKDLDGIALTFSKVSGPTWLTVQADGTLAGTPRETELGENKFVVSVKNDLLGANAELIVTVKLGMITDTVQVDKAVPGAKAENLWVVDSSKYSKFVVNKLKNCIHYYYDPLDKAQIHHTGVYLSSDAKVFDGNPIQNRQTLMKWSDPDIRTDFKSRTVKAYTNNCWNTPIWSMFRFYEKAPSLTDIWKKDFFMPHVPMDAMMVSQQKDHYPKYAQNTPQSGWTAGDFAGDFIDFHTDLKKPLRVSAMAPECPKLIEESGEPWTAASSNAYRTVVKKTGGTYYPTNCNLSMCSVLGDYARKVIFRAYVYAKREIPLSHTPMDPAKISVTLGGKLLGADKWSYDSTKNAVLIDWMKIDINQLKPGDEIEVTYRVS